MVEEGEDVSAFESFTLDDAGGEKAPPKEKPKEEAAESPRRARLGLRHSTTLIGGEGRAKNQHQLLKNPTQQAHV